MKYTMVLTLALMLACSVPVLAQPVLQVGDTAPEFDLKDQFGKAWSLSELSGRVAILVAADTKSGRMMGPWVDNLKNSYEGKNVQIVGLLDLHTVPGIGRGIARSRIKRETDDPMMLDFSGKIGRAYDVSSKRPVVVVIGRTGIVKAVTKTTYDQQAFGQITKAVDSALQAKS